MSQPSGKAPLKGKKPYADFPLTPHPSGKWAKKIRGTLHYFGQWGRREKGALVAIEGEAAWKSALEEYLAVKDDLHAGRTPRKSASKDELTVKELGNRFLVEKKRKVDGGEISSLMFYNYQMLAQFALDHFGKTRLVDDLTAEDFGTLRAAMAKKWGPVRLANSIVWVRSIFKFGFENGLLDRPVRYGSQFDRPTAGTLRRHRATQPAKVLEPKEVHTLLEAAPVQMRALILLGLNCGFGQSDCAGLSESHLNFDTRMIDFPRPKTGIARRCPLWSETVAAIRAARTVRPKAKIPDDANHLFLSCTGLPLVTRSPKGYMTDFVSKPFINLLKALGFHRKGIGFYTLRHIFETIAGDAKDQVAVDLIMGHLDATMASQYRERVNDDRLRTVAEHVRKWLWPDAAN